MTGGRQAAGPLAGLKLVEFAGIGPAPFAGMLLADMGADVILIRRPSREAAPAAELEAGGGRTAMRGKRSIAVDLRNVQGAAAALRMIERADALIEGYRPGVMERLGLGPETCLKRNPRLLYGRMTGWGQSGPLAQAAGHDLNFVALSGALACGARADGVPWAPPSLLGDMAGGMLLAFGIACAAFEARASGLGQVIDAAMIDAAALMSQGLYALHAAGQWNRTPGTNLLDSGAPFYDSYQCADGAWITLAALEPRFYALLIDRLGLASDPLFADQFDRSRWPEGKRRVAAVVRGRTREQWRREFEGTDVCFAPVLGLHEAPLHPHHAARGGFVALDGAAQPAPAPRLSRTPAGVPRADAGSAESALAEYGFSAQEIDALRSAGVIET